MLNLYLSGQHTLRKELVLRYWQLVLRLTQLAAGVYRWACIFIENLNLMMLAFLAGLLIGLVPLLK